MANGPPSDDDREAGTVVEQPVAKPAEPSGATPVAKPAEPIVAKASEKPAAEKSRAGTDVGTVTDKAVAKSAEPIVGTVAKPAEPIVAKASEKPAGEKSRAGTDVGTVTDKPVAKSAEPIVGTVAKPAEPIVAKASDKPAAVKSRAETDVGTLADKPPSEVKRRAETDVGTLADKPPSEVKRRAETDVGTLADKPPSEVKRRAETDVGTLADKPPSEVKRRAETDVGTLADKPPSESKRRPITDATVTDKPGSDARGVQLPEPDFDALARTPIPTRPPPTAATTATPSTVAGAMHSDEVRRTRQFIAVGWAISVAAIGTVPFLHAPRYMSIAMVIALVWGIVMSSYFFRKFADPANFSESKLVTLGVLATINTHVAILYFGVFTSASVIIVLGMHFVARSEAERAIRILFATAMICYLLCSILIVAGVVDDPGVFASQVKYSRTTLAIGAASVLGAYTLAFYTGGAIREASASAIDALQRQTRLAAQRKALMDELRADLERALRVGGPGRHTDQTVGSFKLGNVIGRGAMGEVYEATHTTTGDGAAVKLLRRELLADPTHVARFLREVRASATLASPHIVQVLEAAADEVATPFLAMERLHGETLAEHLRGESRLPPQVVVDMCKQVGAGIDVASRAGIVHRDLKPQNLMLARQAGGGELWKVLDFGVATLADDTGTLTQGGIIGTPTYMAPEQARGGRVDGRADVYALAAVAYRCLTGRHPFTAPDTPALLFAVVHRMPMRPCALGGFHEDLDRWGALALAKSPDDRFATGAEVSDALAMALRGELDVKLRKRADALIKKFGWEEAA